MEDTPKKYSFDALQLVSDEDKVELIFSSPMSLCDEMSLIIERFEQADGYSEVTAVFPQFNLPEISLGIIETKEIQTTLQLFVDSLEERE